MESNGIRGSSWTLRPAKATRQQLLALCSLWLRLGEFSLGSLRLPSETETESEAVAVAPCHDSLNFCFISNAIACPCPCPCPCTCPCPCPCASASVRCVLAVGSVWVQGAGLPMGDRGGICVFLARAMWQMHTQASKAARRQGGKEASRSSRANQGANKEARRKPGSYTRKNRNKRGGS